MDCPNCGFPEPQETEDPWNDERTFTCPHCKTLFQSNAEGEITILHAPENVQPYKS